MNTQEQDYIARISSAFTYGVVAVAIGAAGFVAMAKPIEYRSYQLVQVHGEESDIIDHDLSVTDCGFAAERLAKSGHSVFCERMQ